MIRMTIGGAALLLPVAAQAQAINREILRHQIAQAECADAHRERVSRDCDERCRTAADSRRATCLAATERRYVRALRIQLRPRD